MPFPVWMRCNYPWAVYCEGPRTFYYRNILFCTRWSLPWRLPSLVVSVTGWQTAKAVVKPFIFELFAVKAQKPLFPTWPSVVTWLSLCTNGSHHEGRHLASVTRCKAAKWLWWNHLLRSCLFYTFFRKFMQIDLQTINLCKLTCRWQIHAKLTCRWQIYAN